MTISIFIFKRERKCVSILGNENDATGARSSVVVE
jgi:hypothetical protein